MQIEVGAQRRIDAYFKWRRVRSRLRSGLLAPYWDDLVAWMVDEGYARAVIRHTVEFAEAFAAYAVSHGAKDVACLTDEMVEHHLDARLRCGSLAPISRRPARGHIRHVMRFLRERDLLRPPLAPPVSPHAVLLDEFAAFLRDHRGIGAGTIKHYRQDAESFLESLGPDAVPARIGRLTAAEVQRFVVGRAPGMSRCGRKVLCSALRSFLRFLHLQGHLGRDLVSCVPVIPSFRLDRLPRALPWEDVQRTIGAVDRSTPKGRRDYAMLLLLATCGIRIGQLRALRLDDIDWRHETLRVRAVKGGRDVLVPLLPAVGEAIIDYLRRGRPPSSSRVVFLRARAPFRPLRDNFYAAIERHARKGGVTTPIVGAHRWRHACATRMVEQGQSLKTVRDVLGHRSVETTFIYTKVDIETLRQAALEWPEVSP